MALVSMNELLIPARKGKYGVGAFEFWSIDSAQAIVEAAETVGVPVILQNGNIEADHAGGYDKMRKIAEIVAKDHDIDIALHLDHADSFEQVKIAVDAGYTSVMMDASHCSFQKNIELTQNVVALAHPLGISVESELGILAGTEGGRSRSEAEALQTKPDEAVNFVKDTGIDALAVAIGTVHGFYTFKPEININRLKEIAHVVAIPLVLHGGSGTPEDKISEAIQNGIAKINICTEFVAAFGKEYTRVQNTEGFKYSVPNLFAPAKKAGYELALHKIKLFKGCL